MNDDNRTQSSMDTSGTHQLDPFARTRPDAGAVGTPGETTSATGAGPAPDTPVTAIEENERGTQVEHVRPAPQPNSSDANDLEHGRARRGGTVKTGALTPAGSRKEPDRLEPGETVLDPTRIDK